MHCSSVRGGREGKSLEATFLLPRSLRKSRHKPFLALPLTVPSWKGLSMHLQPSQTVLLAHLGCLSQLELACGALMSKVRRRCSAQQLPLLSFISSRHPGKSSTR